MPVSSFKAPSRSQAPSDEESGGFAGVAHLAEIGRIAADRTDHVIIPEPLNVDRICLGHRGVYWFQVTSHGRIGHGSMPFLGVNAIEQMGPVLEAIRTTLGAELDTRTTTMPVEPPDARRGSININSIIGGQAGEPTQTPCVADRCEAIFDRRFLVEEGFEATRDEIVHLLDEISAVDPQASLPTGRSDDRSPHPNSRERPTCPIPLSLDPSYSRTSPCLHRQPRHIRSQARRPYRRHREFASPMVPESLSRLISPTNGAAWTIWWIRRR